jgi:hypothetical protein
MRMKMRHISMMAVLALGAAACEDGGTNTNAFDDAALRADVALVAADAMFQDLAHMESATVWAGTGFAPEASGIEIQGSRSFSRTVTFFDAGGTEQDSYDPLTTASMHIVSSLTREVTHTFWSAEIERHRDMTVTGLEGEETQRTWNGTGTGDVEKSRHPDGGPERTYDMTSSAVISGVVRGVPRSENPYPLSGTITRTVHAVITVDGVEEVRDIVAVIEFDGDNTATMTVDGDTWEINLDEKGVMHRFQRRNG